MRIENYSDAPTKICQTLHSFGFRFSRVAKASRTNIRITEYRTGCCALAKHPKSNYLSFFAGISLSFQQQLLSTLPRQVTWGHNFSSDRGHLVGRVVCCPSHQQSLFLGFMSSLWSVLCDQVVILC